ncbi:hypothetical protein GQ600_11985 [Phytophthora cactorum]|nr:hypothetical protein GQ600_11985 [Phytophthora cactorum]
MDRTFAVAATLALAKTQAETAAHLHVRVHAKDGCVTSGNVCVANINGDCPSGAHCEMLDTGVYGARTALLPTRLRAGLAAVEVSNGDCPSGASCQKLDTGVFGCVATPTPPPQVAPQVERDVPQRTGEYRRGWLMLDTGVYGCADGAASNETSSWAGCNGSEQTIGVVGWDHDGCIDSDNVCVAQVSNGDCPQGAYCSLLDTVCTAVSPAQAPPPPQVAHKSTVTCPSGQESIAVAGWSQDGCVASGNAASTGCNGNEQTIGVVGWDHDGCIDSDNVCVAQVSNGECPSGSSCQKLDTGVFGCVASSKRHHHHKSHHKSTVTCPSGQESIAVAGWSQDGCVASGNDGAEEAASTGCNGNEQTIGVVGWDHDGCIDSDNVCVAQVSNGDCPKGAYCSLLDTGVYGCVASSKH